MLPRCDCQHSRDARGGQSANKHQLCRPLLVDLATAERIVLASIQYALAAKGSTLFEAVPGQG